MRFVLWAAGVLCWLGPPTLVTGGDVPKDQREAVAQVLGIVFLIGAIILGRIDHYLDDEDED